MKIPLEELKLPEFSFDPGSVQKNKLALEAARDEMKRALRVIAAMEAANQTMCLTEHSGRSICPECGADGSLTAEELAFVADGKLTRCIRSIRERLGLGLIDAKDYMDRARFGAGCRSTAEIK